MTNHTDRVRAIAEEVSRRWLDHDLPNEAALQSLSLLQLQALAEHVISRHLNEEGEKESWIDNLVGAFDDSPNYKEIIDNERRARQWIEEGRCPVCGTGADYRAGIAACVAVTADRQLEDGPCYCLVSPNGREHSKHCLKVRVALKSLDSAPSGEQGKVCAQCESNARNNEAGGYNDLAKECREYCLRGHKPAPSGVVLVDETAKRKQALGWILDAADAAYIEDADNKRIHEIFNIAAKATGVKRRLPDDDNPFQL